MAGGESMWKLMGGLLALPVLLVLSVLMIFWGSGDYVRTVQLNWELELPASEGCLYETDSGASFSGDGERYHVLAYADDSGLEETLTEEATPVRSAEVPVTEILDLLAVPADQRPDFSDCRGFTAAAVPAGKQRRYPAVCGGVLFLSRKTAAAMGFHGRRLAVSLIPHLGRGRTRDRPAVLPETIFRTRGRADPAGSRTGGKRHRHGDAPCRRPGI